MNVDPTTATIALGALVVISSLVGMLWGFQMGIERIMERVIDRRFGWLLEWRKAVDEDRAQIKKDESGIRARISQLEIGIARLEAHR